MLSTSVVSLRVLGISLQCLSDHFSLLSRKPTIGAWRADEGSTGLQYRINVDTEPVVTTPKRSLSLSASSGQALNLDYSISIYSALQSDKREALGISYFSPSPTRGYTPNI
jgi:hypothetical protein